VRRILVREFGNSTVLRLEEAPTPIPGPSDVLVRIRAAGVNPVETYIRAGTYARKPNLPYVPGSDGAGEVLAVGGDVTGFNVGDRVYTRDRLRAGLKLLEAPRLMQEEELDKKGWEFQVSPWHDEKDEIAELKAILREEQPERVVNKVDFKSNRGYQSVHSRIRTQVLANKKKHTPVEEKEYEQVEVE
jgi:hypothetical protein